MVTVKWILEKNAISVLSLSEAEPVKRRLLEKALTELSVAAQDAYSTLIHALGGSKTLARQSLIIEPVWSGIRQRTTVWSQTRTIPILGMMVLMEPRRMEPCSRSFSIN
ncbi:MAG: hypothetical protein A6F70_10335 [Cycloclasticus sp. symbiont of Bathymodiolus heckerae]|nr:MAG: hypothetical protein A6F70_10335 [Cycloclasticus sp. symbiont of Bathymodiolus heckerae]